MRAGWLRAKPLGAPQQHGLRCMPSRPSPPAPSPDLAAQADEPAPRHAAPLALAARPERGQQQQRRQQRRGGAVRLLPVLRRQLQQVRQQLCHRLSRRLCRRRGAAARAPGAQQQRGRRQRRLPPLGRWQRRRPRWRQQRQLRLPGRAVTGAAAPCIAAAESASVLRQAALSYAGTAHGSVRCHPKIVACTNERQSSPAMPSVQLSSPFLNPDLP